MTAEDAARLVPEIRLAIGYLPQSVVEFGCGSGARLQCWRALGVGDVVGIGTVNHMWPAETLDRRACLGVGAEHIFADPTQPIELRRRFDLSMAIDVAGRVPTPAARAGELVDTICAASDRIVFCADADKLEYWSRLFRSRGYLGQDLLRPRIPWELPDRLRQALLVFCRADKMIFPPSFEVLVPSADGREERALSLAIGRVGRAQCGLTVRRNVDHQACVDKARTELAEMFMRGGSAEYAVFIDADEQPTARQILDLVTMAKMSGREVLAAFSSRKSLPSSHAHGNPIDGDVVYTGAWGPQQRLKSVGFGMVAVHRDAFRRIAGWSRKYSMHPWAVTTTHIGATKLARDFFRPVLWHPDPGKKCLRTGAWVREYLSEDVSFCARFTAAGGSVWATPAIWPGHVGRFTFEREHAE